MKEYTLMSFASPIEFIDYIKGIDVFTNWKIENGFMNDRGNVISCSTFFDDMRKLFELKKIFRKKVSIAEMTTWLDTFVHMERLMNVIIANFDSSILDEIEIGFEYVIRMSKKARVDYYIKYNGKVCLLEFSTVSTFSRLSSAHVKKRTELLSYKDMILNYDENHKLFIYPFIGLPEYSNCKKREKFILNNKNNIMYLYEFLKTFILK